MTEINLRDVDQLEFLRTTFEILKNYYEQRETVLTKKRKLVDPTTEHLQANKRARTEKSREEIINESEDERSTATNATNNTNNNNNNADERSEVSQARNNATTNGNRQSSDRLNWEFDRKAGPEDCYFFDFSSSTLRQVYPSLSYDTEKEEMARQYTQIDQVIGELNVLIKNIATARALWNTNKKDFLRTLKSNPDFKNLLSNAPEELKKAIFAEFEAEFSMFFVREGVPVPRPFLTDDMIKKLRQLQGKYVQGLINGDLLHVPFSNLESEVLQLSPVNKTTIDQVCLKLPGRTGKDILRYLDQRGNGELGSKPIIYEDKTKYLRKLVAHQSTGKLARRREYGSIVSPANHKRIVLKSVLKQLELIGSSNMPSDAIVDCKIDPNGTKVLVGTAHTNTNSITHLSLLYDLTQGSVRIFNDHKQTVSASMFSLDGSKVITASYDKDIIVRSASTGVVKKYLGKFDGEIFEEHEHKILNVIPHYEDPNMIASFCKDTVFIWDLDIGRSKAKLPKLNVTTVVDIAFGRGRYKENLFVGTEIGNSRGELQIWDLERVDKPVQVINESRGMISSIGTSSCEEAQSLIVYATQDQLRLYDLRKRSQVSTLKTLQKDVNIVSFSPCERYVQSSATDNRCLVFDVRFPSHPVHIFHHEPPPGIEENAEVVGVNSTKWTHFGTFLVTGGEDSMVRIWDIASGTPLVNALPGGNSHISSLDLSRSDDMIVCGDESGRIHLFSTKDSCYSLSDMKPIRMRAHGAPDDEQNNGQDENNVNNNSVNSENNSQPSVLAEDVMRRNVESFLQEYEAIHHNTNNNNNNDANWGNNTNLVNNTNRM